MADIQLQPLLLNGLAQLSGNPVPNLNLKTYGVDTGAVNQGIAAGQMKGLELQQQKAVLANAIVKQMLDNQGRNQSSQIQAQGRMGSANLLAQASMANNQNTTQLGYDKLNTDSQLKGQELGIQQQNADTQTHNSSVDQWYKQNQINDTQADDLHKWAADDFKNKLAASKFQLDQTASSMNGYLAGVQQTQDPKAQAQLQQMSVQDLVNKGLVAPDQAKQLQQMNPQDYQRWALTQSGMTAKAVQGKAAGMSVDPNGNLKVGLSQANQTAVQQDVLGQQRSLLDIGANLAQFNPDLFTISGLVKATAGQVEGQLGIQSGGIFDKAIQALGAPGVDDSKSLAAQKVSMQSNILQSMMDTLTQQKGVRFNKMTLDALEPEVPHMSVVPGDGDSPDTAFSKFVTLLQRMQRGADMYQQIAATGQMNPNSSAAQSLIQQSMSSAPVSGKIPYVDSQGNQHQLGYQDIQKLADSNKMSFQDAMKGILTKTASDVQNQQQAAQMTQAAANPSSPLAQGGILAPRQQQQASQAPQQSSSIPGFNIYGNQ